MITRKERDELLSEVGLNESELRMIFTELKVDYDSEEFDEGIIEQVEATAQVMGLAVNKVKRLNAAKPAPKSSEIVAQQIGEMMFASLEQQGISLSPEAILALAQSKAEQYIALSDKIQELAERVFAAREQQNTTNFTKRLLNQSLSSRVMVEELLDDAAQQQLIGSLVPDVRLNGEVQEFRNVIDAKAKAREQVAGQRAEAIASLPRQDPKAFLNAFLASQK